MLCVTVRSPWAELLVSGAKGVEYRGWAPRGPFPLRLGVHVGRREDGSPLALAARGRWGVRSPLRGCVLGEVEVLGCDEVSPDDPMLAYGRYAWRLGRAVRYDVPIPAKGQLGLWELRAAEVAEQRLLF